MEQMASIGVNYQEAKFLEDAIVALMRQLLNEGIDPKEKYPNADISNIYDQLKIAEILTEA